MLSLEKIISIWVESHGLFENVMVETGVEANGMVEITSEMDSSKKVVVTGLMPLTVNTYP
jgi:Cu(I)/Ag(I) efflux system membrane fusion protein